MQTKEERKRSSDDWVASLALSMNTLEAGDEKRKNYIYRRSEQQTNQQGDEDEKEEEEKKQEEKEEKEEERAYNEYTIIEDIVMLLERRLDIF